MSDPSGPAPQAGREGDEEQEPQTEEERMMEEISKQKGIVDAVVAVTGETSVDVMRRRAPHQKKLSRLEFQYHLLVEQKRLAHALSRFEEEHGAVYTEPCLLCLEDIHIHAAMGLTRVFGCCGGFICKTCERDIEESVGGKCPLCRASYVGHTEAERVAKMMTLAERGILWAQSHVASCMLGGILGFEKKAKSGLKWLNKAAAQNHPPALYELSRLHREGFKSLVRQSQEKANGLLLESANLGYARANGDLAKFKFTGMHGFEKDYDESHFRASVAFALDTSDLRAALLLGSYRACLPESVSPYLACYYLNIAASEEEDGAASYLYSQSLILLASQLHHGKLGPNGSNASPAVNFWLRKARDMGHNDAVDRLKKEKG